ncbi:MULTISPECIES: hemolysin family protein [unclassified Pseudonocardia]|uniref:hemolysin family protein n=1 Tax=unclassified Pseudonocardia TaxID=2619320 RepID=UPI0001FFEF10|nr:MULTISPECIES: hemolysin family protein [unclassified Pseudonocardia]ALE72805.1 membrane protein [Pseudonocardia sp. EC080625-04]ALL76126.1 membrane protein [Pseudonocardia sp. EC080610-09]ALL83150.1 membrane protein [Pseudonocardia sp. EC080619-01]OLM19665.1 Magnesium and cobalt efflux protein CorC [Pseudonocardia sp. Ae707_Ps1]
MIGTILGILLGILVVLAITALTGYFVAQEFGYMAVDRSRLKARAAEGDAGAARALDITRRTSFMLSGAQLGITVTGLLVGYVAEPLIGDGIGELLGVVNVPAGVGAAIGIAFALLLSTVVQMVFGELFPKNLAIARPEPVARALALSTKTYLAIFGWIIKIFDAASNVLLRALRIEPVHDVEHSATRRDLEAIIDDSKDSGDIDPELATLLDRAVDFSDRTARAAMIPRPRVSWVRDDATVESLIGQMAVQHSRYPVLGTPPDAADPENAMELVGVVCLKDVLALSERLGGRSFAEVRVSELMRVPVLVPSSLPLPQVLARLREEDEELACVLDEYGGLAGVITVEDVAEELVGEITDEHDQAGTDQATAAGDGWVVPGDRHVDEVGRLIDAELPDGDYQTVGGLVMAELQRLPETGDEVTVVIPADNPDDDDRALRLTVQEVDRRVPAAVHLVWTEPATSSDDEQEVRA